MFLFSYSEKNRLKKLIRPLASKNPFLRLLTNLIEGDIYLHGGVVRDTYYQKKINDIDIRIFCDYEQKEKDLKRITKLLKVRMIPYIREKIYDFDLLKVHLLDQKYDITILDKNSFTSCKLNTDFRLHTVYINLKSFHINDSLHGLYDLKYKKLTTCDDPQRIFNLYPEYILRGIKLCITHDLFFHQDILDNIDYINRQLNRFLNEITASKLQNNTRFMETVATIKKLKDSQNNLKYSCSCYISKKNISLMEDILKR